MDCDQNDAMDLRFTGRRHVTVHRNAASVAPTPPNRHIQSFPVPSSISQNHLPNTTLPFATNPVLPPPFSTTFTRPIPPSTGWIPPKTFTATGWIPPATSTGWIPPATSTGWIPPAASGWVPSAPPAVATPPNLGSVPPAASGWAPTLTSAQQVPLFARSAAATPINTQSSTSHPNRSNKKAHQSHPNKKVKLDMEAKAASVKAAMELIREVTEELKKGDLSSEVVKRVLNYFVENLARKNDRTSQNAHLATVLRHGVISKIIAKKNGLGRADEGVRGIEKMVVIHPTIFPDFRDAFTTVLKSAISADFKFEVTSPSSNEVLAGQYVVVSTRGYTLFRAEHRPEGNRK
eukprot:TRINITY_DN5555_c0_g1_i4.p1 TRINITY_DN5555_c0_g1~~TRINITY_DN5555_c0_g1_i4.p1  ORF type:complete len:408 (-),score=29.98 TRINITY_DN5555_c0_g1_i4:106-1149(-)